MTPAITSDGIPNTTPMVNTDGGLWYAAEIALFLPVDLLTVRIRDAVIPRAVKRTVADLHTKDVG